MNPGLQSALDVHRGSWRVNPPCGHKEQRREQPKKRHSDDKPSEKGSKKAFPKLGLAACVGDFSHISE
jgi:hypothetical protein